MAKKVRASVLLASFFILAAICFLCLEIVLHAFFYFKNGFWLFEGNKNFSVPYVRQVSDRRTYVLKSGFSDGTYTINEEGFRGEIIPDKKLPTICVIGDSVPYGAGVSDRETFPVHLQTLLDDEKLGFKVLNAGIPSYNLRQSIDRWRFDIKGRFNCKAIVLNAANDVSLADYYREKWTVDTTWASHRFKINDKKFFALPYYVGRLLKESTSKNPMPKEMADNISLEVLKEIQVGLNEMGESGAKIVLLPIQPCYYRNKEITASENVVSCHGYPAYGSTAAAWGGVIDKINERLKAAADSKNISYLDTTEFLDLPNGREGMFVDFIHFSDQGNALMAKQLLERLREMGVLREVGNEKDS